MIEHKYSTFWPRYWAGFVDELILMPIGWFYSFTFSHSESVSLRMLAYILNSGTYLVYSIWMHGKYGQTLGKMVCKVMVLDVSEQPLRMRQAVLRDIFGLVFFAVGLLIDIPMIAKGIDVTAANEWTLLEWILSYSALGWFFVEIVTMLTNKKRRSLHDFIAGSVVVRKFGSPLPATTTRPVDY
jgi:uncharacterized RDD family membrane protein YckC